MKVRNGFVSNSSSSSFVCNVCGRSEGGYDMSYEDVGMCLCNYGHELCLSHLKFEFSDIEIDDGETDEIKIEKLKEFCEKNNLKLPKSNVSDLDFYDIKRGCNFPSEWCPVCNLEHIEASTIVSYISTKFNVDNIEKEIKSKFDNLSEVIKFVEENKK